MPANCGCPSTIIRTALALSPPTPRSLIWPAPPLLTPNPKMLRCDTKRLGTMPDIADSTCVCPAASS